jgi:hypothetical protein
VAKLRLQLEGCKKPERGARGRCIKHIKNQVNVRLTAGRDYELATTAFAVHELGALGEQDNVHEGLLGKLLNKIMFTKVCSRIW